MKLSHFFAFSAGAILALFVVIMFPPTKSQDEQLTYVADTRNEPNQPRQERVINVDGGGKIIVSATGTYFNGVRFAVNQQLTFDQHSFHKNDLVKSDPYGDRPNDLVKRLLRLPGVSAVTLDVYDLSIDVGDAFDKQWVEAAVISVLENWLKKPIIYENEVPKPKERPAMNRSSGYNVGYAGTF